MCSRQDTFVSLRLAQNVHGDVIIGQCGGGGGEGGMGGVKGGGGGGKGAGEASEC